MILLQQLAYMASQWCGKFYYLFTTSIVC